MNPVVLLFLALNGARVIGFPMDQATDWRSKDSSSSTLTRLTQHPRTRSLPHFPLATANGHTVATGENTTSTPSIPQPNSRLLPLNIPIFLLSVICMAPDLGENVSASTFHLYSSWAAI